MYKHRFITAQLVNTNNLFLPHNTVSNPPFLHDIFHVTQDIAMNEVEGQDTVSYLFTTFLFFGVID